MYDIGETPESLKNSAFGLKGSAINKNDDNNHLMQSSLRGIFNEDPARKLNATSITNS